MNPLQEYVNRAKIMMRELQAGFSLNYIPREKNRLADKLAKNGVKKRGKRVIAGPKALRKVRASKGRMAPNGSWGKP